MDDNKNLTGDKNFPIAVPPADTGWRDMRRRLDDEMPEGTAIINKNHHESRPLNKLSRLLILLVLFSLAGYMVIVVSNKKNENKLTTIAGGYSNKNEKDTITAVPITDNGNEITAYPEQRSEFVAGKIKYKTNRNTSIAIKSSNYSNIATKSRPLKTAKGKNDKTKQEKITNPVPADNTIDKSSVAESANMDKNKPTSLALITAPKTKVEKKPDSLASVTPPSPETREWKLKGGLSWSFQVPTASTGEYFTGANTKSQPYTIFLPGAWIQAEQERHLLTFELDPFASNLLPQHPFRTFSTYESISDTTVITVQTRTLQKLFGASAGLGYAYNVSGSWWLGGGLQFFWWREAVASSTGEIQKVPTNGSPSVITSFKVNYAIEDEWSYFSKFQACINTEGIYKVEKWQAGLRMGLGFTPLAKNEGPSHPLRFDLFYRLKLFNIKAGNEKKQAGFWSH